MVTACKWFTSFVDIFLIEFFNQVPFTLILYWNVILCLQFLLSRNHTSNRAPALTRHYIPRSETWKYSPRQYRSVIRDLVSLCHVPPKKFVTSHNILSFFSMEKVDNDTWNSNLQGYVNCIGRLAEILDYMYKDYIKMLYNGYIQVIIILMNI